jgi:hypothetical protein
MALTIARLFAPTVLPIAVAVIYTVPASPASSVLKNGRLRLVNTSGAAVTVSLYADAAANASGPANCFLSAQSIAAGGYLDVDIPTMTAGDTLRAAASAATSITCHEMAGVIYS